MGVTISEENMPINQYVDSPRKTRIFDASNLAASTIDSNILTHKPIHTIANKHQKTKSSKKVKQKGTRSTKRKRNQNYSDDIDYDDSDNNAAVAGADEADSIGEADDIAGGITALEGVSQDEIITYQTQHEYQQSQPDVQYETVTADQVIQQSSDGQPLAQFYIQQTVSAGVGEDGKEVLQVQYIPLQTSLDASNGTDVQQQFLIQQ